MYSFIVVLKIGSVMVDRTAFFGYSPKNGLLKENDVVTFG
jgi:hypothetical protein